MTIGDDSVFDLDVIEGLDPTANHPGCYLITPDVDAWRARMQADGLPVTDVDDMPWGIREFTLRDPDGNNIRVGRSVTG